MARKEPREVAGLGRPETPEETRARVEKARAERRSRQTIRNLVWSLLASLGVVVLLVLVVARPDQNLVQPVDWKQVAATATEELPGAALAPTLPSGWVSNRAEIEASPGTSGVWSLGLISDDRQYVFLDQGFGADPSWVAERTQLSPATGEVEVPGAEGSALTWVEYDRQGVDAGGNYAYLLVLTLEDSIVVLGGSDAATVVELAGAVSALVEEVP